MLKIVKVSGRSLYPEYQDGDFLIISKIPIFFNIRQHNLIVFRDPIYGRLVKEVHEIDRGRRKIFVQGSHPDSLDSRQLGWIDQSQIVGKVLFHIKKRRG